MYSSSSQHFPGAWNNSLKTDTAEAGAQYPDTLTPHLWLVAFRWPERRYNLKKQLFRYYRAAVRNRYPCCRCLRYKMPQRWLNSKSYKNQLCISKEAQEIIKSLRRIFLGCLFILLEPLSSASGRLYHANKCKTVESDQRIEIKHNDIYPLSRATE